MEENRNPRTTSMSEPSHFIYIIECSDESLYTGYTTDIERRIAEHNNGTGAKYTRGRTPVVLRYSEVFDSRSDAMQREYEIKQFSREQKEDLISEENPP